MATPSDVRRIALSLPAAEKVHDRFAFGVRRKGQLKAFAWVWMERVTPKKPRVPNPGVLAVRVADLEVKKRMLAENPASLFSEPHYDGFPAVLVRLEAVTIAHLRRLITEAWRCQAPVDYAMRDKRRSASGMMRRRTGADAATPHDGVPAGARIRSR